MKRNVIILLVLLFIPFAVYALDEEEIKNYEQDIVEAYEEEIGTKEETHEEEQYESDNSYVYTGEENEYKLLIEDDANLLSEEERNKLVEDMKPLTLYGHIVFKSIVYNPRYRTADYAREYYHNKFGSDSGTLFLIDMDRREIYIFSDGENYEVITDSKAYLITDNIYKMASARRYYDCASEAFKEIRSLLEGRKIVEPMRHITNALISITLGFFGTFLFMLSKTKIPKASVRQLLEYSNVSFNMGKLDIKKTGTSRKYNPPSSSSGGGSSGSGFSGGGGGGSSGGGGGHSF